MGRARRVGIRNLRTPNGLRIRCRFKTHVKGLGLFEQGVGNALSRWWMSRFLMTVPGDTNTVFGFIKYFLTLIRLEREDTAWLTIAP